MSELRKEKLKKILESMEQIATTICEMQENPDIMDSEMPSEPAGETGGGDEELLNSLNQIFTPILVMQGFEGELS